MYAHGVLGHNWCEQETACCAYTMRVAFSSITVCLTVPALSWSSNIVPKKSGRFGYRASGQRSHSEWRADGDSGSHSEWRAGTSHGAAELQRLHRHLTGPGMAMSRPPFAASMVERVPS